MLVGSSGISESLRRADEIVACEVLCVRVVSAGTCKAEGLPMTLTVHRLPVLVDPELESNNPEGDGSGRSQRRLSEAWTTFAIAVPVLVPITSTLFESPGLFEISDPPECSSCRVCVGKRRSCLYWRPAERTDKSVLEDEHSWCRPDCEDSLGLSNCLRQSSLFDFSTSAGRILLPCKQLTSPAN